MGFFICVIGMVMIVEGFPYFTFPERMREMLRHIAGLPDATLRKIGFALMAGGLLLAYLGKCGF